MSMLESGWLAPHDPLLNFNSLPITALSTYHKSAKGKLPPPFPQIPRVPQIKE